MKVKIVIKVELHCEKCRNKPLIIAAAAQGVTSLSLEGEGKDVTLVVTGNGIDSVKLTNGLRKKFRCVTLVSVEELKDEDGAEEEEHGAEEEDDGAEEREEETMPIERICYFDQRPPPYAYYHVVCEPYPSGCFIM